MYKSKPLPLSQTVVKFENEAFEFNHCQAEG